MKTHCITKASWNEDLRHATGGIVESHSENKSQSCSSSLVPSSCEIASLQHQVVTLEARLSAIERETCTGTTSRCNYLVEKRLAYLEEELMRSGVVRDNRKLNIESSTQCKIFFRKHFPIKLLNTFQGFLLDFLGFFTMIVYVAVFLALFFNQIQQKSTHDFLSTSMENYHSPSKNISCIPILTVNSVDVQLDENGYWSSSSFFSTKRNIKQVHFESYQGTLQDFKRTVNKLNSCIVDINKAMSLMPTLTHKLLALGFFQCAAKNTTLSFDITWPYVFDTLYGSWAQLASTSGKVIASTKPSNNETKQLIMHIPSSQFLYVEIPKIMNARLNLDSLARCLSVNEGVLPITYVDDLIELHTRDNTHSYVYGKTSEPDLMIYNDSICSLIIFSQFSDENTRNSYFLVPKFAKRPYTLTSIVGGVPGPTFPCTIDFELSLQNDVLGIMSVAFYGQGEGMANALGFSPFLQDFNVNGVSEISALAVQTLPFQLETPGVFSCIEISLTHSPTAAAGTAFANASAAINTFIACIVVVGMILMKHTSLFDIDCDMD